MPCRLHLSPEHAGPAKALRPYSISAIVRNTMVVLFAVIFSAILLHPFTAGATTLIIPYVAASPGHTVEIPIMIDQIENLAGIKLILSYDKTALKYVRAVKGKAASSLMHVVNDKKPGQLIIVMAGAKGIKGKDVTLMTLTFKLNPVLSESIKKTEIAVNEIQVMDDRLKEVKCGIKSGGVGIVRQRKANKLHGGKK